MVRMRALESGRDVLRATNTGISALIDHRGTVRQRSEQFVRSRLDGEVQGRSGATPYVGWGDWPAVLLAFVAALSGAVICRGRAKKST
jgi:apolipoprotein N-acyltransferase